MLRKLLAIGSATMAALYAQSNTATVVGTVTDPFGHKWTLGTRIEDVAPEELSARMAQWSKAQASQAEVP